jgi:endonuclease-8
VPEGDTLARTAAGLRPYLLGRTITAARTQGPGPVPQVQRIVGAEVTAVDSLGKNLLIRFGNGLEIRTHLRMTGTWHRYRPGERWRRPPARARLVLEVPGAVAVCFDAPVVELLERQAEPLHPPLGGLGPDLLSPEFDLTGVRTRFREPGRAQTAIGEALVDQRAVAGIGNIWKAESLWAERVDPFVTVGELDDETLDRLVLTARRKLQASVEGRPEPIRAYRRTGRPCPRCRTPIRSASQGLELPRLTYWCPACAGPQRVASAECHSVGVRRLGS